MDPKVALDHRAQVGEFQRRHRTALVTMLFSDIVGSTNLKQTVGDRGAIDAIHRHHAIFREILGHFDEGAEIGTFGDSFFIVFTKPSDAVKFSLLAQDRVRRLATETGCPLFDRIGIHVGEVWVKKTATVGVLNELDGIQVDTCARVSSLGGSDQILLTRFAFDSARQVLKGDDLENLGPLSWLNHGPYTMKGVDEPIEVCEVGEIGKAKLALPCDTEKAHRFISADSEPVLGWRPAVDQLVPGTSWILEKKIGEGGFGEVWLGRDKLLKTPHIFKFCFRADRVRSLKREATLFRLLNKSIGAHPNIVALEKVYFDEPPFYIVMQYVEGSDLAKWCLAQGGIEKIPLAVRLEIIAQVADGLQAAHDSGIIHRDVKPSNIIVSGSSIEGVRVHLTDFGIGRVVSREVLAGMTQQLGFTETMVSAGSQSGTYMYMAPELARGEAASPGSDIYSLAVVLFQLLAGDLQRPLTADWAKRVTDPLLKEDLACGLATDPTERFASAKNFAQRLRSLPVRRADASQRERRRKRGRALQLIGAAAVAIVLVTWIWQRAAKETRRANEALVAAQQENQLLRAVMEYSKVEAEVRGSQPNMDPAMVQEQIYVQLGKQYEVDPKILRVNLPRFAEQLRRAPNVGTYERANGSYVANDYLEAERLALQAADEAQKIKPTNPRAIIQALELAGLSSQRQIQYTRAMSHFREAEKLADRNRNLEEWAILRQEIADLLVVQGKYVDAENRFRSVIDERTRALGPEHPDTLDSRHRLIYALTRQTKYPEAEAEAREVLKLREKVLGTEHIDTVVSRYNLADTLAEQGKNAEGESLYREIIRANEKALGSEHPRTLAARVGLATALGSQGKNAEAESLYREIIRANEKVFGPEHPNTLNARNNLATTLQAEEKYSEAEAEYRDVIKIDEKMVGPEHPDTLICRNNLAEMLDDAGKYAEAETECQQIIGIEERVLGPENLVTLNSRGNLAVALICQGRFAEAEVEYKDVLERMERVLGLEHPDTVGYTSKFVVSLSHQHRTGDALKLAKGTEERARKILGPGNPSTQKYAGLVKDLEVSLTKTLHSRRKTDK